MYKPMNFLKPSFLIMLAALSFVACNTQSKESPKSGEVISEDVQIYYFHNTKRFATCNAIEDETKVALEMY